MASVPTRIDDRLYAAAKAAGKLHSRSVAEQIGHWARLGRALDASPAVSVDDVSRVLSGRADYDDLSDPAAQASVRAAWSERLDERIAAVGLEDELRAAGEPWFVAGDDGRVVARHADD